MPDRRLPFGPTASWANLRRRAELLGRVRHFFDDRGFLEVETPLLSHDTVVDVHLDPLAVSFVPPAHDRQAPPGGPRTTPAQSALWLQTSPEFCMKRMLAAGATAIYQVTRAVRADEQGPLHNPEFTMVEWYRVGDSPQEGIQLLDELAQQTLVRGPADRMTYAQAFRAHAELDPHRAPLAELAQAGFACGLQRDPPWDPADRDAWLDWLLVTQVQPHLGIDRPLILSDFPASQAALARVRQTAEGPVAERFELYANGIELANGYHELTDADELLRRMQHANRARQARGKPALPESSRLLDAMRHGLPASTGVALGFDRLVLVALGATDLSQVMAFPGDLA